MCDKTSENGPEWKSVTLVTVIITIEWKNADTYIHIHK